MKSFFELIQLYKKSNKITNFLTLSNVTFAKTNLDQLKQILFFRGYISNSRGYLYELPIMQNFLKGLNCYEYFLSCYGSRKGVLDTSLRTADSGYLTRRLVEIVQDIVIKEKNCFTNSVFLYSLTSNFKGNLTFSDYLLLEGKLIGRNLCNDFKGNIIFIKNKLFNVINIDDIFINKNINYISLKSVCLCISGRFVCDLCFGSVLKNQSNIGQSLGIISGQSIGEPATQLTLRTFHTGGVFFNKNRINTKKLKLPLKYFNLKNKLKFNKILISNFKNNIGKVKNINIFIKKTSFFNFLFGKIYNNNLIKILKFFSLKNFLENIYFFNIKNKNYTNFEVLTISNLYRNFFLKKGINTIYNIKNSLYINKQPLLNLLYLKNFYFFNTEFFNKSLILKDFGELLFINSFLIFTSDFNLFWKFEILKEQFVFQKIKKIYCINYFEGIICFKLNFSKIFSLIKKTNYTSNFSLNLLINDKINLILNIFSLIKYLVINYKLSGIVYKEKHIITSQGFIYNFSFKK